MLDMSGGGRHICSRIRRKVECGRFRGWVSRRSRDALARLGGRDAVVKGDRLGEIRYGDMDAVAVAAAAGNG